MTTLKILLLALVLTSFVVAKESGKLSKRATVLYKIPCKHDECENLTGVVQDIPKAEMQQDKKYRIVEIPKHRRHEFEAKMKKLGIKIEKIDDSRTIEEIQRRMNEQFAAESLAASLDINENNEDTQQNDKNTQNAEGNNQNDGKTTQPEENVTHNVGQENQVNI